MTARVGIFGGSFDPVHDAHLALARRALDDLALDELRWLPAGNPWQKQTRDLAPPEDRAAMLALALEGEPSFTLDRRELERPGPTYTLDSIRELKEEHGDAELVLLMGEDQYAHFDTWHGWREIARLATLAVAARPGSHPLAHPDVLAFGHRTISLPLSDISATEIRTRIAAGEPIADLVPAAVAGYIDRHRLYRGTSGS